MIVLLLLQKCNMNVIGTERKFVIKQILISISVLSRNDCQVINQDNYINMFCISNRKCWLGIVYDNMLLKLLHLSGVFRYSKYLLRTFAGHTQRISVYIGHWQLFEDWKTVSKLRSICELIGYSKMYCKRLLLNLLQ